MIQIGYIETKTRRYFAINAYKIIKKTVDEINEESKFCQLSYPLKITVDGHDFDFHDLEEKC